MFFSPTQHDLDTHQTISHENRFHERDDGTVSQYGSRGPGIIRQLQGSRKNLTLEYTNSENSLIGTKEASMSAKENKANSEQVDELARDDLSGETLRSLGTFISSYFVNVSYRLENKLMSARV